MSPKLPRITAAEVEHAVWRDGWSEVRQSGSHRHYGHAKKPGVVTVPMHRGRTIPPRTLKSIIESMGLTIEEFRRLL